ncbi:MAG: pectin esterase, partial [Duncaniella sp.]|nr:pectin esterase [Duncaniella sp.]
NWGNQDNESTARYVEYNCTVPGAARDKRAGWAKNVSADEAKRLTDPAYLYSRTHTWTPGE